MRYLLVFLIAIGLIVLIFVLLLKNFGGSSTPAKPVTPLISYATTNTVVQMTINGPVVADPAHEAVQVTIGQSQSQITIYQGYQGVILTTKSFQNNEPAYAVFLRALDIAGFSEGNPAPSLEDDRGYCSQGDTYNFEILNGSNQIQNYWTSTCSNDPGTTLGASQLIISLFQAQIPGYSTITQGVHL
jgi:hypothetical protein